MLFQQIFTLNMSYVTSLYNTCKYITLYGRCGHFVTLKLHNNLYIEIVTANKFVHHNVSVIPREL